MANVLAVNCGSSSLKFQLIDFEGLNGKAGGEHVTAKGIVDRIGSRSMVTISSTAYGNLETQDLIPDHGAALRVVCSWLENKGLLRAGSLHAVGHRIVHGGDIFTTPVLIDNETIEKIDAISYLAPLHNEHALKAVKAAREMLGPGLPQAAM